MIVIRPHQHDLVDCGAVAGDREVLRGEDGRTPAIASRCQSPFDVADVPREQAIRHDLGGTLRHGVDDRMFDQSRQPVGHAQDVHRRDQVVRAHGLQGGTRVLCLRCQVWLAQACRQEQQAQEDNGDPSQRLHVFYIP